ncbi:MAG: NAD(P)H-binding protein [Chloroflexi bacterium]|nr:NAD(P)H-binding protein [Chloroflexota bacterium]
MARGTRGILVTGGGSFLGSYIAAALLAEGLAVSLLVQPGAEDKLGQLSRHTRWSRADVWSPGSLRGKARDHAAVIHTVGSLSDDPAHGASFERLNLVSARNVANMCISDGVERLIFISGSRAPWLNRGYIQSKRAAEAFLRRSGLRITIVRAPLLYARDQDRALFFRLCTRLGKLPPLAWLGLGNAAPLAVELLARGVAQLALADGYENAIVYARELQTLARHATVPAEEILPDHEHRELYDAPDEDLPFGWTPGNEQR